jgi:uncharacterized integral membrane protein
VGNACASETTRGASRRRATLTQQTVQDAATRIRTLSARLGAVLADGRRADLAIAYVRLAIVPFAFAEVVVESYPAGDEPWAWAAAGTLALGAVVLLALSRRVSVPGLGLVALAFDVVVVSCWVVLYGYEPGSPVRQLLFLPIVEAALRYGLLGALVVPPMSIPALALFEWRQSERVEVGYDVGHALFPVGLQLVMGLVVGALVEFVASGSRSAYSRGESRGREENGCTRE